MSVNVNQCFICHLYFCKSVTSDAFIGCTFPVCDSSASCSSGRSALKTTPFTSGWTAHPWSRPVWSFSPVRQKPVHWRTGVPWRGEGSCGDWQTVTSAVFSPGLSPSSTWPWVSTTETKTWSLTCQLLRTLRKHPTLKTLPNDFNDDKCVFCVNKIHLF